MFIDMANILLLFKIAWAFSEIEDIESGDWYGGFDKP